MACDSQTIVSSWRITGTRPCGFIAKNSDVSSPPNWPPASICSCASPSSPITHITFWTLNDERRPQTFSIFALPSSPALWHVTKKAPPAPRRGRLRGHREACMRILGALAAGLMLLLWPALAAAQDFPAKPIRLIVPFPAGGPNDIIARLVGQRMSELTKQPVLVDNRGGQAGVLGTDAVAKANPDGYTIGIVSASALVISPTMERVPYNVGRDFAPVTLVVTVPEMLVVASKVPANNMAELVALTKEQPGK